MNLAEAKQVVEVNWADRWSVYHRLQELEIPCQCAMEKPLTVQVTNPTASLQIWSVLRQIEASRQELVQQLESCWQISVP